MKSKSNKQEDRKNNENNIVEEITEEAKVIKDEHKKIASDTVFDTDMKEVKVLYNYVPKEDVGEKSDNKFLVSKKLKGSIKAKSKKGAITEKKALHTGRKSKYFSHVKPKLESIKAWCRNGATEETIFKKLGVSRESFYTYKRTYVDLFDALKSKDEVDDLVENALLKRALGFKEKVRKPMKIRTDQYSESVVYVDEETYYPPDTTAQIYWTKNRRRDKWANSDRLELAASSTAPSETNEVLTSMSEQVKNLLIAKQVKEDIAPLNEEIGDGK